MIPSLDMLPPPPHLLLHSNKNTFETKEKIEVYIKSHIRQYVAVDIIH